jgi:hypothetical protein
MIAAKPSPSHKSLNKEVTLDSRHALQVAANEQLNSSRFKPSHNGISSHYRSESALVTLGVHKSAQSHQKILIISDPFWQTPCHISSNGRVAENFVVFPQFDCNLVSNRWRILDNTIHDNNVKFAEIFYSQISLQELIGTRLQKSRVRSAVVKINKKGHIRFIGLGWETLSNHWNNRL